MHRAFRDLRFFPTRRSSDLINFKTGFPDVWLADMTRGNSAPFTFGPSVNASAVWSPDGGKILFLSTRTGRSEEHTSEIQSLKHLVCRLLLGKQKVEYLHYDR